MIERYVSDDSGNDVERLVAYCGVSLPALILYFTAQLFFNYILLGNIS